MRRVYGRKVARLTLGGLSACPVRATTVERRWEGPAEVSRGHSSRSDHRLGVKVNYCCGSDEATIRTLIEAGVDYILTDDIVLCGDMIRRFRGAEK